MKNSHSQQTTHLLPTKALLLVAASLLIASPTRARQFSEPRYTKSFRRGRRIQIHPLPISEEQISFSEFEEYHDAGNYTEKFPVFKITKRYFKTSKDVVNRKAFIYLGSDFLNYQLAKLNFTIPTLLKMHRFYIKAFNFHFKEGAQANYTFYNCYRYTIRDDFVRAFHRVVGMKQLPEEFKYRMRLLHPKLLPHEFDEMFMNYELDWKSPEQIRHQRKVDKFNVEYSGVEWKLDGRKVTDDDYDDPEPAFERENQKIVTDSMKPDALLDRDDLDLIVEDLDLDEELQISQSQEVQGRIKGADQQFEVTDL